MKKLSIAIFLIPFIACNNIKGVNSDGQKASGNDTIASTAIEGRHYFIDVHDVGPGKVTFADVAAAHKKDLATEGKYGVKFTKFFVNEKAGKIYCLSESPDAHSIYETHKEAHGLVPAHILRVTEGEAAKLMGGQLFLDIHRVAPGSVTPEAVAEAHKKDLAVQEKHGVNFINYWVDEKDGIIMCLSEAPDSNAIIDAHREAHGLLPSVVMKVKEGK